MADRGYWGLSEAIDSAGAVHFVGGDRSGLYYGTNAGGRWAVKRIEVSPEGSYRDSHPAIAIDEAGTVIVAYDLTSCFGFGCGTEGIFVTRKASSTWSTPEFVATGMAPSIATAAGTVGIAYSAAGGFGDVRCDEETIPVGYSAMSDGGWLTQQVASDGDDPRLTIGRDGTPHVVFTDPCGSLGEPDLYQTGIYLAIANQTGGPFVLEPIPCTTLECSSVASVAVDDAGRTHVLFQDGDHGLYSVLDGGAWSDPIEPITRLAASQMAVDDSGIAHFLAEGEDGIWHATNSSGAFTFDQVAVTPDVPTFWNSAALALDGDGRPHTLFKLNDSHRRPGALWYGVLLDP